MYRSTLRIIFLCATAGVTSSLVPKTCGPPASGVRPEGVAHPVMAVTLQEEEEDRLVEEEETLLNNLKCQCPEQEHPEAEDRLAEGRREEDRPEEDPLEEDHPQGHPEVAADHQEVEAHQQEDPIHRKPHDLEDEETTDCARC